MIALGWDKGHIIVVQHVAVASSSVKMSFRELKPSKSMGSYVRVSATTRANMAPAVAVLGPGL